MRFSRLPPLFLLLLSSVASADYMSNVAQAFITDVISKQTFKQHKPSNNEVISPVKQDDFAFYMNKQKCDQVIDQQVFKICYDYKHKSAKYVAYTLSGSNVNAANIKERGKFYTEDSLPAQYRTKTADFIKTGYDRGHLANDASFDYDEKAMRKTYTMANIVPQSPNLNEKTWIKAEKYERDMAIKFGNVNVVNAVIYDENPPVIGRKQNLFVPKAFWKKIYNTKSNFAKCFIYENEMPLPLSEGEYEGGVIETIDIYSDTLEQHEISCNKLK